MYAWYLQVIVSSLQQYILQFTQRLHDAEVERRDLRIEVSALRQSQEGLSTKAGKAELMEQELMQLRQQVSVIVDVGGILMGLAVISSQIVFFSLWLSGWFLCFPPIHKHIRIDVKTVLSLIIFLKLFQFQNIKDILANIPVIVQGLP